MLEMVVSLNRGTQYRPKYTIVLIMGTPRKVPPILGNPQLVPLWTSFMAPWSYVELVFQSPKLGKSIFRPCPGWQGILRVYYPPIKENQMEKKMENEMETTI